MREIPPQEETEKGETVLWSLWKVTVESVIEEVFWKRVRTSIPIYQEKDKETKNMYVNNIVDIFIEKVYNSFD